ncbi:MAG: exodeoxyribonuclease III [Chloroflexi bacterium]|nr:exodeoxyribonuclease III [Chloroflexota bacterium]MBU1750713.1 exodeoxyribonuclease III [Chloroflexota bacterium]
MPDTITLLSWNVNGARAIHKKGFLTWLDETAPDIVCLQETRAAESQLAPEMAQPAGYHGYWNASRARQGYSGTGLLTKAEPLDVQFGLGVEPFDQEGRTIVARYLTFTLINCYFPNGSRDHSRVPFKLAFYKAFLRKCQQLRAQGHAVVFCGDVNTAHQEIDLAHPKSNQKTTGFLPEERAWLDQVVADGYVDTFRHLYPDLAEQYTWWSMPTRARERNVGWRIDYFFVAAELLSRVVDACIQADVPGSDHCPVGLRLRDV